MLSALPGHMDIVQILQGHFYLNGQPRLAGQHANEEPATFCNAQAQRAAWHIEEAQPTSRPGPWLQHHQKAPAGGAAREFAESNASVDERAVPSEAPSADCLAGFDDFDWGEFDMECQVACNTVETYQGADCEAAEVVDLEEIHEEQQEVGTVLGLKAESLPASAEGCVAVNLTGSGSWDDAAMPGQESQLQDCKTTNAGIQVHRCVIAHLSENSPALEKADLASLTARRKLTARLPCIPALPDGRLQLQELWQ